AMLAAATRRMVHSSDVRGVARVCEIKEDQRVNIFQSSCTPISGLNTNHRTSGAVRDKVGGGDSIVPRNLVRNSSATKLASTASRMICGRMKRMSSVRTVLFVW